MTQSHIGKFIVVCLLICSIMGFIMKKYPIIVNAEGTSSVMLVDSDIGLQETSIEKYEVVEEQSKKWMDIGDVLGSVFTEMLGACLGFLSAIMLTNLSNRKQMKELDSSLLLELRGIKEELEKRFRIGFEDYYCYQTPIWDINLESGALALVGNSKVYNKYIQIYSKIQYAQGLESEYVHTRLFKVTNNEDDFADRYIKTIDDARKREAKNIHEYIEKNILGECGNARRNSTADNRR